VNNTARVSNPNPAMWRIAASSNSLKLTLTSATYSDETIIRFDENASDKFDGNYDAMKLKNPDLTPSFYSFYENTEYSINTLSLSDKTIPLHIEAGFSGIYTISQKEVAVFTAAYSLVLEDKLLKTYTDLKTNDYTFSINPGEGTGRFNLIYKNTESTVTNQNASPSVIINSDGKDVKVNFTNLNDTGATFSMYNSIGQLITTNDFNTNDGLYIYSPANIVSGIYIVKVIIAGKVYSSKVYLN
jgi:hypothetical protein